MRLLLITLLLFISIAHAEEVAVAEAETTPILTGAGTLDDPITTHSTANSTVTTNGTNTTKIEQPPPSAISPQFSSGSNSDLCTIGVAGAVQTQILGISAGGTFTEENCLRLKNAKTMYDMGMKVAAVSIMCQDKGVFDAMMHAGTPCPYNGKIGSEARLGWETHVDITKAELEESEQNVKKNIGIGGLGTLMSILLF